MLGPLLAAARAAAAIRRPPFGLGVTWPCCEWVVVEGGGGGGEKGGTFLRARRRGSSCRRRRAAS